MCEYIIKKSMPLSGKIQISGAKNAALPAIAASYLTEDSVKLKNIPKLSDVNNMFEIADEIGADILTESAAEYKILPRAEKFSLSYDTVSKLRGSFLFMGPLLAKYGKVKIPMPGGCRIGSRPVDLHLKGFSLMGADCVSGHGFISVKAPKLHGAQIYLDFPSVGATENIMMAACLADGETVIENAAAEPEISDLALMLVSMGAKIDGIGTDTLKITGTKNLHGCTHSIIPDRIEAGTFMIAAVLTGGTVTLCGAQSEHIKPLTAKMREIGVDVDEVENCITVKSNSKLKSCDIKTMPFPGFPTDMQAQFYALLSIVPGTSIITETVFENRFMYVSELQKMGAKIKIDGRTAVIEGTKKLSGARVSATDLRAGAALVVAGLAANGTTKIGNAGCIDRGYEDFDKKLSSLGAYVEKLIR